MYDPSFFQEGNQQGGLGDFAFGGGMLNESKTVKVLPDN
jgi:hypothetical protein